MDVSNSDRRLSKISKSLNNLTKKNIDDLMDSVIETILENPELKFEKAPDYQDKYLSDDDEYYDKYYDDEYDDEDKDYYDDFED
jgi:hypothetical protein